MSEINIYTIADLHLSFGTGKPMDIFGETWQQHDMQIAENWNKKIGKNDWVVIPGDISWAMTENEVIPDLAFINGLAGNKILMRGNHEYWWPTLSKLALLKRENNFDTLYFMRNNAMQIPESDIVICGTRGWKCPGDNDFSDEDNKIYKREIERLELSLKDSERFEAKRKMCFMHFPPFNSKRESSEFTELLNKYEIEECFYGHIHGVYGGTYKEQLDLPIQATFGNLKCYLVSADYISFNPVKIS